MIAIKSFLFLDPEGDGLSYFNTPKERDEYANLAIQKYLNEGEWSEDVFGVIGGIITHRAAPVNLVKRPHDSELDEGNYDFESRHDCKLLPLK